MGDEIIVGLIVVCTAIWAGFDSASITGQLQARDLTPVSATSPVWWFLGCILLWIVVFPYYLFGPRRHARTYLRTYEDELIRAKLRSCGGTGQAPTPWGAPTGVPGVAPLPAPLPPVGWYPDPSGIDRRRYWDGRNWGPLEPD